MPNNVVKTTFYFESLLTADINPALAAPTLLAAAKMGPGTAVFSPGVNSTIADCAQAASTGLAISATIVWGAPINELDGSVTAQSPSHLFRATVVVPEIITNVYLTDGSTDLLGCALISPTIPIANVGDGFSAIAQWNQGYTPGNCNVVIIM
jgi:hypothetical protein